MLYTNEFNTQSYVLISVSTSCALVKIKFLFAIWSLPSTFLCKPKKVKNNQIRSLITLLVLTQWKVLIELEVFFNLLQFRSRCSSWILKCNQRMHARHLATSLEKWRGPDIYSVCLKFQSYIFHKHNIINFFTILL